MFASRSVATFVRSYATTPATGLVKSPLVVHGLAGRYAQALYSAATKSKSLPAVESEMALVKKLIADNAQLSSVLSNASLKRSEKRSVITAVLTKGGFSPLTINLFDTLAENNRLSEINSVTDTFSEIMRAHRKEIQCIVTSAKALSSAEQKNLESNLLKNITSGQKLLIESKVDPTILGGVIVEFGDKRVDLSIQSKIKELTTALRATI